MLFLCEDPGALIAEVLELSVFLFAGLFVERLSSALQSLDIDFSNIDEVVFGLCVEEVVAVLVLPGLVAQNLFPLQVYGRSPLLCRLFHLVAHSVVILAICGLASGFVLGAFRVLEEEEWLVGASSVVQLLGYILFLQAQTQLILLLLLLLIAPLLAEPLVEEVVVFCLLALFFGKQRGRHLSLTRSFNPL